MLEARRRRIAGKELFESFGILVVANVRSRTRKQQGNLTANAIAEVEMRLAESGRARARMMVESQGERVLSCTHCRPAVQGSPEHARDRAAVGAGFASDRSAAETRHTATERLSNLKASARTYVISAASKLGCAQRGTV